MGGKINLLLISYYYPPAGGVGLPGTQRAVKFVKYLESVNVSVLTLNPDSYPDFIAKDFHKPLPISREKIHTTQQTDIFKFVLGLRSRFRDKGQKLRHPAPSAAQAPLPAPVSFDAGKRRSLFQSLKDSFYDWCYFPDPASPWIFNAVARGMKIVKAEKTDVIFASGMPWSALIIAYLLHKFTGIPYICDFRDPWIGNPYHKSKGKIIDGFSGFLEARIVLNSTLLTANTEQLRLAFQQRYPSLGPDRIVVLSNGFDPEDFKLADLSAATPSHEALKVVHAGFLYGARSPSPLLKAMGLLQEPGTAKETVSFIQIGSMEPEIHAMLQPHLESGAAQNLGQVPYGECLSNLATADLLVIIQQGTDTQVPSKLYDYLCLNRPILTITSRNGALWTLVEQNNFGFIFEPHDVEGIAACLRACCLEKRREGRLTAEYPARQEFDVRGITAKLAGHLRSSCSGSKL